MILILFLVALAGALFATRLSIALAEQVGLYDQPGELKVHTKPISRLGGIGLMFGLLVGLGVWFFATKSAPASPVPFAALCVVWLVGLADDIWNIHPVFRLAFQLLAGCALWLGGWRANLVEVPSIDLALTAVLFAFFVNSMNFLDGMDGLALGTAAIYFGAFVFIAPATSLTFIVGICALAASLGALVFNLPAARTFIGDSGSNLLGALMCFLALDWTRSLPEGRSILTGLLLAAIPLLDAVFAITRRLQAGGSPMLGDRSHYYDLLLQRNWSQGRILAWTYAAAIGLAVLGWLCATGTLRLAETSILAAICLSATAYFLRSFGERRPLPAEGQSGRFSEDPSVES